MSNYNQIKLSGKKKTFLGRSDNMQRLFNDIRRYKVLKQEEIIDLFKTYHNGTENEKVEAYNKIFNHNLRLVVSQARDYCPDGDILNDLIQEGSMGLMKAIEMFDEENGTLFAGYAMYWIRRYINMYMTNVEPMINQTNKSKTVHVISSIKNDLLQKYERTPTLDEILHEYNTRYPNKRINNTTDLFNVEYIYIDKITPSSTLPQDMSSYGDYFAASSSHNSYIDDIDSEHTKSYVDNLLGGLTEKESTVIKMYYGLDGFEASGINMISSRLGVTSQRVSRAHATALEKLKNMTKKL